MGSIRADRYRLLSKMLGVGVIELDEQLRVLSWCPRLVAWTGVSAGDARGRSLDSLFPKTAHCERTLERLRQALTRGRGYRSQPLAGEAFLPIPLNDESPFAFQLQQIAVAVFREKGSHRALVTVTDVTPVASHLRALERGAAHFRQEARGARHEADYDRLTQLLTRAAGLRDSAFQASLRTPDGLLPPVAVLLVDLDHFKRVNDRFGHDAGDEVLRQAAARLRDSVRRTDIVARYGGEEFLVVLPGASLDAGRRVGRSLLSALRSSPIEIPTLGGGRQRLAVTCSVGMALREAGCDQELSRLISKADGALYAAKKGGRDRLEIAGGTPSS